jgi:very-short-patch-repair endonuclease
VTIDDSVEIELPLCESPLELELGLAIVRLLGPALRPRPELGDPKIIGSLPHWGAGFLSQWPIGRWRIDFTLLGASGNYFPPRAGGEPPGSEANVVNIEVDGHEYHERTKEQARRDRSRDRKQLAWGWIPLRFTGWEVYHDADACAHEALTVFFERQRRVLDVYHDVKREPWSPGCTEVAYVAQEMQS